MPFFSIITVCFNSERTIERTLKSVLEQTFADYEYIIVDGGSKDGTLDIIKRYELLFEGRMRWISESDNGIYDAMNKGVKCSAGTYVWIVNSDDYIEQNSLSVLWNFISNHNSGNSFPVICGASRYFDEESGKILYIGRRDEKSCRRIYALDKTCVIHPATLVPKDVYERYGYYDDRYKIIGDCDWARRVYKAGVPILFMDHVITNMSNGGISGTFSWSRFKVNHADRRLYFKKFYPNLFVRYARFLLWDLYFVRRVIKAWF